MSNSSNLIYDFYVIGPGDMPVFSGCTVSKFCLSDVKHQLQSGLLSALRTFSSNVFPHSVLKRIEYNNFDISYLPSEDNEYLFASIFPKETDGDAIMRRMRELMKIFKEKHRPRLEKFGGNVNIFDEFKSDLTNLKFITADEQTLMKNTNQIQDDVKISSQEN